MGGIGCNGQETLQGILSMERPEIQSQKEANQVWVPKSCQRKKRKKERAGFLETKSDQMSEEWKLEQLDKSRRSVHPLQLLALHCISPHNHDMQVPNTLRFALPTKYVEIMRSTW